MPDWLNLLAVASLALALLSAVAIAIDIVALGHRQPMRVMEIVWPVTALYFGPVAIWAYRRWGRSREARPRGSSDEGTSSAGGEAPPRPSRGLPVDVALAVTHCGAGCTLGDIVGALAVLFLGLAIADRTLWAELVVDFAFAYTLGIVFQYFTIAPMRGLGIVAGLRAAVRADTLSLVAFEIGMFGWMVGLQLLVFTDRPLSADEPMYWLMMQVGMVLGFVTAFPANWWLVSRGIKERMGPRRHASR